MRKVLDDERRDGAAAATVRLRSARVAWSVGSYEEGRERIELACQQTGGAADVLVPADGPREAYARLLDRSTLDVAFGEPASSLASGLSGNPFRRLPALLTLAERSDGTRPVVEQVLPAPGDLWHLAYLTAFGSLGQRFNPTIISELMLREDLAFDEFISLSTIVPDQPGVNDLLSRLQRSDITPPVGVSLSRFTSRRAPTSTSALDGWLADRETFSRQAGSPIIVLYTPGDIGDLCLAWNLRARHGWVRGLPLALPFAQTGPQREQLHTEIGQLVVGTGPRIMGWPVQLTSSSVPGAQLAELAAKLGERGQQVDVVELNDVLLPAAPPARTSRTPVVFSGGRATIAVRTDRDRVDLKALEWFRSGIRPRLDATVAIDGDELAPSAVLRQRDWSSPRFTDGGASVPADSDELAHIQWPTGWERFAGICADRGVRASPSASGRTALALLRQLGELDEVRWLAHRPLLDLLYSKAASSGMSWWKRRSTDMAAAVAENIDNPEQALEAIATAVSNVSVSLDGDSAATLTYSDLVQAMLASNGPSGKSSTTGISGADARGAAKSWLAWAEMRRLLVRGASVQCPDCQHKQWRLVGDLAPPLTCPGCLRSQERPYADSTLNFTFRLGEPLRRAIENDSLYHLLVARFAMVVLESSPVALVGVHPGVDFTRDGQDAEADVVLLLADGDVVPVEVKTRSAGFKAHDVKMLDRVVTWFDARASIAAAGDSDEQMTEDFKSLANDYPAPVRRLLTSQDWMAQSPQVSMGTGYPGPDLLKEVEKTGEVCAVAALDVPSLPGPARKTPQELELDFVAEVIRVRPERPRSLRISEKMERAASDA